MSQTITISPLTRIEGHLAIKVETDGSRVTNAFVSGEMFRGFEAILQGRHPLDAQQITQRICGVCPVEHGIASVLAQDMVYGVTPPPNGILLRNLIQGANIIASHITHFYHLSALDFLDIAKVADYQGKDIGLLDLKAWVKAEMSSKSITPAAPFLPRYESSYIQDSEVTLVGIKHYLEALEMRRLAHQMGALFSGKLPHAASLVPGGATEKASTIKMVQFESILSRLRAFIDTAYLPDVAAVAGAFPEYFELGKGCGNFLSYGVFAEGADGHERYFPSGVLTGGKLEKLAPEAISEDIAASFFSSPSHLRPDEGETIAASEKPGAYSWLKAPRYSNQVMEVGPLARLLVAYREGRNATLNNMIDYLLKTLGREPKDLVSVLGRHAARAIECKLVADRCLEWLRQLVPDEPTCVDFQIPQVGRGFGLTEAARGALGHWIEVRGGKISRYQCVVPTTWNCSPRDDRGIPGAVEQALIGTPVADSRNPMEVARVVRSFDPCIACAVH